MSEFSSTSVKPLLEQRTRQLLKILVITDFFGPALPSLAELIKETRLPKNVLQEALVTLENESVIRMQNQRYGRVYPPHGLKRHRVGIITHTNILQNAYGVYQDFVIGIGQEMIRPDVELILAHELNSFEAKIVEVEEFVRSGVDSLIVLGRAEKPFLNEVLARKIPTVICGNSSFDHPGFGSVCNDNFGGMRQMVRHVIEQGHTEIGYYTTDLATHDGFYLRLLGYREAMRQEELMPREELIFSEPHTSDSARRAADLYLTLKNRPTTVVCASDRDAFELVSELHRNQINVPGEVGITGFDNNLFCEISDLNLATMDIHAQEVGRVAGQSLLRQLDRPQFPLRIMIPPTLVSRSSVPLVL